MGGKKLTSIGDWAVVTGATDGIGKAIALELATQKLRVVLVSRSAERLEDTKKEVLAAGAPACEILAVDLRELGKGSETAIKAVKKGLSGKNIAVLVNNAGVSYDYPEYFEAVSESKILDLVHLNAGATAMLTRLVLPEMSEKIPTKESGGQRGVVVTITTSGAVNTCPLLAGYAASKTFCTQLMGCLEDEYGSRKGIHFQAQVAHFVTSKLSKIRKPSITTPTPAGFAKASVKAMGFTDVKEIAPYWSHAFIVAAIRNGPTELVAWGISKLHLDIRRRALKKAAEGEKQE